MRALNPRRRGDSPFAKLTVPGEADHPLYTEAQLVLWADTFVNRGPDRDAFKGPRGELLERAVDVRRLAEKAAAADERVVPWVMPRVEAGDRLRRQAQDRLFSGDAGFAQVRRGTPGPGVRALQEGDPDRRRLPRCQGSARTALGRPPVLWGMEGADRSVVPRTVSARSSGS